MRLQIFTVKASISNPFKVNDERNADDRIKFIQLKLYRRGPHAINHRQQLDRREIVVSRLKTDLERELAVDRHRNGVDHVGAPVV